jgi:hypothetical protein
VQVGKLLATLLLVPALIEPAQRRTSKPRCLDPTAADALVRGLICQQSGTSGRGDRMGCQCAQRTSPVCPPEGHRVGRCVRRTSAGFGSTRRRSEGVPCSPPVARAQLAAAHHVRAGRRHWHAERWVHGWADTLLKERGDAGDVRGGRPLAPARTARATTCKVRKSRPRYLARHRSVCGKSEDALQPCSLARQETAPGREPLHDVVPCHSFLPHRILRLLVVTASQ